MDVVQLRETENVNEVLHELTLGADSIMQVDCAGPSVSFIVVGWFVFPKGSLHPHPEVTSAA